MSFSDQYIGRYAPSPTGDLHLGNLQTALLAWLHARLNGGQFLLRMEDLDTPRVIAGSAENIIQALLWLGIDWDGPVSYQSERIAYYDKAFETLVSDGRVFSCFCSRKDIREAASAPHGAAIAYPGTCRALSANQQAQNAINKVPAFRLRCDEGGDDFVIKRADGIYAYHLAVTVDDLEQGITHVVRGADLHDSQMQQLQLAQMLAPSRPAIQYNCVPLRLDESGHRMSKRDGSESARVWQAQGYSAEQLLAKFANELGLIDGAAGLTAIELLQSINLDDWQRAIPPIDG